MRIYHQPGFYCITRDKILPVLNLQYSVISLDQCIPFPFPPLNMVDGEIQICLPEILGTPEPTGEPEFVRCQESSEAFSIRVTGVQPAGTCDPGDGSAGNLFIFTVSVDGNPPSECTVSSYEDSAGCNFCDPSDPDC